MMICKIDAVMTHIGEVFMDYKKLYFHLFNAVTDAIEAIERQNYGQAAALLIAAQQETEEMYMDEDDEDESSL